MAIAFSTTARPLIIGGMHRSGTSLTASLVASAGLDLGPELIGASASNPLGHFEDVGFQEFHARVLLAHGVGGEGYTTAARGTVPQPLHAVARGLVEARMAPGTPWGWKDPRTTLFLDFWAERLPQARYLFVVRRPWEVADSLYRRGDEAFVIDPVLAFDVWAHYNRRILDFVRRHPGRCAVFAIEQVIRDPERVLGHVRDRFELPLAAPANRYRESLFTRDEHGTRASLVRTLAPEAWLTYLSLLEAAGADDDASSAPATDRTGAENAVLEWAWTRRLASRGAAPSTPEPAAAPRRWRGLLTEVAAVSRRLLPLPVAHEADHAVAGFVPLAPGVAARAA
ncbi:MAG: sulfotransferase family protein [Planctomycetaceae bacterium]